MSSRPCGLATQDGWNFKVPDWTNLWQCSSFQECTLPSQAIHQTIIHKWDRHIAERIHNRSQNNWVGEHKCLFTEKGQLSQILCRLRNARRHNRRRLLSALTNGQGHRAVGRSAHLSNFTQSPVTNKSKLTHATARKPYRQVITPCVNLYGSRLY